VKEPVREIEVEVLPPGAIPRPRKTEPEPEATRVYTRDTRKKQAAALPESGFDDPFIALVSRLMDNAFTVPGTNIRFGLDPIIGLVAGYGDAATAITSLLMLMRSAKHGVPNIVLGQMALNIVLNSTVGAVPVVGDAFSFYFKSNQRNYELLRKHAGTAKSAASSWLFVVLLLGAVGSVLVLTVTIYATMLIMLVKMIRGN
jgi:hypothetical protein